MAKITSIDDLRKQYNATVAKKRQVGLTLEQAQTSARQQIEHDLAYSPEILDREMGERFLTELRTGRVAVVPDDPLARLNSVSNQTRPSY